MEGAEPDGETLAFTEPEYSDMLIARLRAANVFFGTQIKQGVTYVVLDPLDKTKWEPIKSEVEALFVAEDNGQLYAAEK